EVVSLGTIGTRQGDIETLGRPRQANRKPLVFVAAAGPGGSWRSRSLTQHGPVCWGIAPSLLPNKPGARVTTTRRDAIPLARLRRAGDLTPGSVPTAEEAAMRALCRAREETIRARKAATCQRPAWLLRHDSRDTGRTPGGPAHLRWLRGGVCPTPAQHLVFHEDVRPVTAPTARRERCEQARPAQGQPWRLRSV